MINIDYQRHNEEVRQFLELYEKGANPRIRMSISCNPRLILLDPKLNPDGVTFEQYFNDPRTMLDIQARFMEYRDTCIVYDHIMGMEEAQLTPYPDFQNILEPVWFGAEIFYPESNDPGTRYFLTDENKREIFKKGMLDPFGGIMKKVVDYYNYFLEQQQKGYTYKGKPIANVIKIGLNTDGPFSIACCLRGATGMCIDLYEDPNYAIELMAYITENIIARIKALRKYYGIEEKTPNLSIADDSIALLSTADYVKFVLPFHKKLFDELTTGEMPNVIHLCGNATRHFSTISSELNVKRFDTGFPVNHGELVRELGEDVTIEGGVHVDILKSGTIENIVEETRRILEDVKPYSRKFIIKEANNLSPGTNPEHILAMYNAVKQYGYFD